MTDQNKELVRNLVDSVFNGRDPSAARRYIADGFESGNPQIPAGADGFQRFAEDIQRALSDFRGEIRDMIAEGDKVAAYMRWSGTHTGRFLGAEPTGEDVSYDAVDVFRIADGKVVEHWDVVDRLALLTGLGLVEQPKVSLAAETRPMEGG